MDATDYYENYSEKWIIVYVSDLSLAVNRVYHCRALAEAVISLGRMTDVKAIRLIK